MASYGQDAFEAADNDSDINDSLNFDVYTNTQQDDQFKQRNNHDSPLHQNHNNSGFFGPSTVFPLQPEELHPDTSNSGHLDRNTHSYQSNLGFLNAHGSAKLNNGANLRAQWDQNDFNNDRFHAGNQIKDGITGNIESEKRTQRQKQTFQHQSKQDKVTQVVSNNVNLAPEQQRDIKRPYQHDGPGQAYQQSGGMTYNGSTNRQQTQLPDAAKCPFWPFINTKLPADAMTIFSDPTVRDQAIVALQDLYHQQVSRHGIYHSATGRGDRASARDSPNPAQVIRYTFEENLDQDNDYDMIDSDEVELLDGAPAWAVPQTNDANDQQQIVEPPAPSHNDVLLHVQPNNIRRDPYRVRLSDVVMNRYNSATTIIDGHTYVSLEAPHNSKALAVKYHDIFPHIANVTRVTSAQQHWGSERGVNRPEILYKHLALGWYAYNNPNRPLSPAANFTPLCHTDGRVFLNPEGAVMRYSPHTPMLVSTDIEPWRMIAIARLDPNVRAQDFVDRMPIQQADNPDEVRDRPTIATLQTRCARERLTMRILAWPIKAPGALGYTERKIGEEMRAAGLTGNSTRDLDDLSKEQLKCHDFIVWAAYAGGAGRAEPRAISIPKKLAKLTAGLTYVRQHGYAAASPEVRQIRAAIRMLQNPNA